MKFPWQYVLVVAALMTGALLLAACGGGEEQEAGGPATATPGAEETAPPAESPEAAEVPTGDIEEAAYALGERFFETSATVSYDIEYEYRAAGEMEGEDWEWTIDGSGALYWRPPDWRVDFSGTQGGTMAAGLLSLAFAFAGIEFDEEQLGDLELEIEATNMVVGSDYYDCVRLVSAEELFAQLGMPEFFAGQEIEDEFVEQYIEGLKEGRCQHQEATGDEGFGYASLFLGGLVSGPDEYVDSVLGSVEDAVDVEISERKIESQQATCLSARLSGLEEEGEGQWCFTNDGIPLLFAAHGSSAEGSGELRLEVKEVSREVSDADFQPPYPVQ